MNQLRIYRAPDYKAVLVAENGGGGDLEFAIVTFDEPGGPGSEDPKEYFTLSPADARTLARWILAEFGGPEGTT